MKNCFTLHSKFFSRPEMADLLIQVKRLGDVPAVESALAEAQADLNEITDAIGKVIRPGEVEAATIRAEAASAAAEVEKERIAAKEREAIRKAEERKAELEAEAKKAEAHAKRAEAEAVQRTADEAARARRQAAEDEIATIRSVAKERMEAADPDVLAATLHKNPTVENWMSPEEKARVERLQAEIAEAPASPVQAAPTKSASDGSASNTQLLSDGGKSASIVSHGLSDGEIPTENGNGFRSVESAPNKTTLNVARTHAEMLSDAIQTDAFIKHGFSGLDAPSQRAMLKSMLLLSENDQIFGAIVSSIPVDVMDYLSAQKLTPESLFHDRSMLLHFLASGRINSANVGLLAARSFVKQVARAATEVTGGLGKSTGGAVEGITAESTIDGRHDATPNSGVVTGAESATTDSVPTIVQESTEQKNSALTPKQKRQAEAKRIAESAYKNSLAAKKKEAPKFSRSQTDTEAFKRWFGDSMVVDADGNPLVVYHGTTKDFDTFAHPARRPDLGFHFGTQEQANGFATEGGARVLPVYLKIENPLRMRDVFGRGFKAVNGVAHELYRLKLIDTNGYLKLARTKPLGKAMAAARKIVEDAGYDGVVYENAFEGLRALGPDESVDLDARLNEGFIRGDSVNGGDFVPAVIASDGSNRYLSVLRSTGSTVGQGATKEAAIEDGLRYLREGHLPSDSYIAFRPEQVKSAISNNGEFNEDDANILFRRGPHPSTGLSESAFRQSISEAFGSKAADKLLGTLIIPLADQSQIPEHVLQFVREGDRIYGFFDPSSNKTYAVLSNLDAGMVRGLVTHELGIHYGFKRMLGREKYSMVMKRLNVLAKTGNKAVLAARANAVKESVNESQVAEETLAYLVQNEPKMTLVQEVIAAVKAFLFREFGILGDSLTVADLHALARASVQRAGMVGEAASAPAFARLRDDLVSIQQEGVRYNIVDNKTGVAVGNYDNRKRATTRSEKLNLEYGAYRYFVKPVYPEAASDAPAFSRASDALSRSGVMGAMSKAANVTGLTSNLLKSPASLGFWNSFNSQYHKAAVLAKKGMPEFKAVFDKLQDYINDTNAIAVTAEQQAPAIFSELKGIGLKDIREHFKGAAKESDIQAIGPWLNRGTLYGGGNPMDGVVWTDDELRGKPVIGKGGIPRVLPHGVAPLNDTQIALYKEARATIAQSLQDGAKSVIFRHIKRHGLDFDKTASLDQVVASVKDQLWEKRSALHIQEQHATEAADEAFKESEQAAQQALADGGRTARLQADEAKSRFAIAQKTLDDIKANIATMDAMIGTNDSRGTIDRIDDQANGLIDHGYMPLKRFGNRTVTAKDHMGVTKFFAAYDGTPLVPGSANAEMNRVAAHLREIHPEWTVTTGIKSEKSWQMYNGLSLDALENFLDFLDPETKAELERDNVIQEYLINAVNNGSVMKELIHRQGTPGFSNDVPRILASFITSHARNASGLYNIGEAKKLVEAIPKEQGDVKDEATDLVKYVTEPGEEAAKLRGFLFFHFLGGSIAAAAVNLTQTPMMTFPVLTQHADATKVASSLLTAAKQAVQDPMTLQGESGKALQKAELDGITAPQQIHHLTATAANNPFSSNRHFRTFMTMWGGLFGSAEVFNRRVAFLAAYDIAQTNGMKGQQAYDFAKDIVVETQLLYNKANKPNLGRGAVGSTVMTFKQFSIGYLELLSRMPPQQQLMMLGIMLLMAGAEGLPFAEDVEDLVDTLGQWLGFSTNTGKWTGKVVSDTLGKDFERPILKGLGGMLPLDLHSRLGMGNLLPGTAFFKPSEIDKTRDVAEAAGPIGGVLQNLSGSLQMLARGRWDAAALNAAPKTVRDAVNGATMITTGQSQDTKGRLAMKDISPVEGFGKMIGFNPQRAAIESETKRELTQDKNLRTVRMDDIASDWADGVVRHDNEKVVDAFNRARQWNLDNPGMPIESGQLLRAVQERVKAAQMTGEQRFLKAAPKVMKVEATQAFQR